MTAPGGTNSIENGTIFFGAAVDVYVTQGNTLNVTSNVGSELLREGGGRDDVLQLLKTRFRPEFLNRIDEIVVFHALDAVQLRRIGSALSLRLSS